MDIVGERNHHVHCVVLINFTVEYIYRVSCMVSLAWFLLSALEEPRCCGDFHSWGQQAEKHGLPAEAERRLQHVVPGGRLPRRRPALLPLLPLIVGLSGSPEPALESYAVLVI